MRYLLLLVALAVMGCAAPDGHSVDEQDIQDDQYTWTWVNETSTLILIDCINPQPCFDDIFISPGATYQMQTAEGWMEYHWSPTEHIELVGAGAVRIFTTP
jgi:hypothetical protein